MPEYGWPDLETSYALMRAATAGWTHAWQLVYMVVYQITLDWLVTVGAFLYEDGSTYIPSHPWDSRCLEYLGWGCS